MAVIIVIWIVCAVLCAAVASAKGHSGCLWGLLGLVFGFFALLVVAVLPANRPPAPVEVTIRREPERYDDRRRKLPDTPPPPLLAPNAGRQEKKCPDCAEMVLVDARLCRHCGYRFDGTGEVKAIQAPPPPPRLVVSSACRPAAMVLRALAEAAGPINMAQSGVIASYVAVREGWGQLGKIEQRELLEWVASPENAATALREALGALALFDRGRADEFRRAAATIASATGERDTDRQAKFLSQLQQIVGSKA